MATRTSCPCLLQSEARWQALNAAYHRLKRINPDEYNGASLLGLTAVVVKSHGGANVDAFARAIADAALQARLQIPQKILAGLQRY